jgi:hypothetical protein
MLCFPMDALNRSCERFDHYPHNVVQHDWLSHSLQACSNRLHSQDDRLFDERHAAVDLLDYSSDRSCRLRLPEYRRDANEMALL